jgi:hypothetical protein
LERAMHIVTDEKNSIGVIHAFQCPLGVDM